jgi:hypothetical protein
VKRLVPRVPILALALPALAGCTLVLSPGEQQCQADKDCAARGFAGAVCTAGVCEMADPVWGCLGHLVLPPNPDPNVKISFTERLAYASDESSVTMATVDICAKLDLDCTGTDPNYPKGLTPDATGIVSLSVIQGFDGFIRITGQNMNIMDSRVFVGQPMFKPPTVKEVRLLRPGEYQLLVAYAKQKVDTTRGTAIVNVEDCSSIAAAGVSFASPNADMETALFYLINQAPTTPPTANATDADGFGGFLNLPVGTSVVQAIRASDQKLIGQSSFQVLANTLSYVLVAPSPM